MRLKEIMAEWLYYIDANRNPLVPFNEQDSNIRDFYHKIASEKLAGLVCSYFRLSPFCKFIGGCIQDVVNAHGNTINEDFKNSLSKRIVSRIPEYLKDKKRKHQ